MEARRKIVNALIYPMVIAGMSLVTVTVLAVYVLPAFKLFFASLHAKLPLPTRMLLGITDFLTGWWWALAAGLITVALVGFAILRTERGRRARDRLFLVVPVVGPTVRFAIVERFCRILSSMVSAGVPLPEAIRVATESVRNRVFTRALWQVREAILEGQGVAGPLSATGLFPTTAAQMMRVGEDTGTLDTQLEVTAGYYEGELDYKLKKLTALFEPVVIIIMGAVVGFVAVALVSAMYGIFSQVHV
jgi:type IV pilus assembly protein PilC